MLVESKKKEKQKASQQVEEKAEEAKAEEKQEKEQPKPVVLEGFEDNQKECDTELALNTINRFSESDTPSKKSTLITALALMAQEFGKTPVSLVQMFNFLKNNFDLSIGTKPSESWRTALYSDYYPQIYPPKIQQVKGVTVEKYAWDNHIYCTIPLCLSATHKRRTLYGVQFKPSFVKLVEKLEIDSEKLKDALRAF